MEPGSSVVGTLLLVALVFLLLFTLLKTPQGLSSRAEAFLLALTGLVLFSIGSLLHG